MDINEFRDGCRQMEVVLRKCTSQLSLSSKPVSSLVGSFCQWRAQELDIRSFVAAVKREAPHARVKNKGALGSVLVHYEISLSDQPKIAIRVVQADYKKTPGDDPKLRGTWWTISFWIRG